MRVYTGHQCIKAVSMFARSEFGVLGHAEQAVGKGSARLQMV